MKLFIAGIMQGSLPGIEVHDQDYRPRLKQIVNCYHPDVDVICPWELHPESVDYGPTQAKDTLLTMADLAGKCDVVVAYLPQASMGTALEMWKAYEAGRVILAISPLQQNWVVQSLSTCIFADIDSFEAYVAAGRLFDGASAGLSSEGA